MADGDGEEEARRLVEAARELQDAAAALISSSWAEEQSLRHRALALDTDLRRLLSSSPSDKLLEELDRAASLLNDGDVASLLPSKAPGGFVRAFLGPINVRASRKDVRLKVKEEYNSYRWIYHHYFAMVMALVSLTWEIKGQPDCSKQQRGVELFLYWAVMQGVAMILQNRYQRQRLYTRIALGKAKRMDVVGGESAGGEGQLLLLCPVLFTLQGFEAYIGLLLLRTALWGMASEWQVAVCGILLAIMAVGNFVNTVQTLMTKSRFKAKMKQSRSKQNLNGLKSAHKE